MKRLIYPMTLLLLGVSLAGFSGPAQADDLLAKDFQEIQKQAGGSTVRFYMFGGWAQVNKWIDTKVAPALEKQHGITLKRVPMTAPVFINKLLTEKAAGKKTGNIDLLWINGENFKKAAQTGLLHGPFAQLLPNFKKYVDPATVRHDFGFPVEGREAPYGRAQFVFEYDQARTPNPPRSVKGLLAWAKANPGRFTYPQPPDFTGSAFIRQLFYALTGGHQQYMAGFDQALAAQKAPALWAYLNELKPYLWQKGRTYPKDSAALDTLFARGEVDLNMSYHPPHAQSKIIQGDYPATVRTYVMAEGSIYNTHFTTIPFNAPNPAGAMVVADHLLSPEAQLSKFDPRNWGDFPALDLDRLSPEQRAAFAAVDLGPATLTPDVLARSAVPEIPSDYLEFLEAGWENQVLR